MKVSCVSLPPLNAAKRLCTMVPQQTQTAAKFRKRGIWKRFMLKFMHTFQKRYNSVVVQVPPFSVLKIFLDLLSMLSGFKVEDKASHFLRSAHREPCPKEIRTLQPEADWKYKQTVDRIITFSSQQRHIRENFWLNSSVKFEVLNHTTRFMIRLIGSFEAYTEICQLN